MRREFYGPNDFTKSYGKSVDAAEVLPFLGDRARARPAHSRRPLYWVTPMPRPRSAARHRDKYVAREQAVWLIDGSKRAA
jgi:hypothetical protein